MGSTTLQWMRQKVIRSLLNCSYDLHEIKRNGIISAEFRDTAKYALLYGVQYMLHLKGDAGLCEEAIKNYAVDLELVFAKLWLSNETASENLLWIQKQNIFQELSDSPGPRDRLWPSRLLGKLANFNFTRIIPGTLVVNAGVAGETLEWAVCSGRV